VQLHTEVANTRAQRAISRVGGMYEGVARADQPRADGSVRDTWRAAIIRTDWPVVQPHLRSLVVSAITAP
jgi:RimJ/RimL family protein N-acetyltransferase